VVQANSAIPNDGYIPIIKSKQGELGAVGLVVPSDRSRLVPLVEVAEPDRCAPVAGAWADSSHVLFVHALNLDDLDDAAWSADVQAIFDELRRLDVAAVPVAATEDSADVRAILNSVVSQDGRGICIRLDAEDIALASPAAVGAEVRQLLSDVGVGVGNSDLLIDVGTTRDSVVSRVTTAEAALRVIPTLSAWRSLVVAFSAFPETLEPAAPKGTATPIPRDDASAFAALQGRFAERSLTYGDYTIGVPFYADVPWAPIPAIRYADGDRWMVHRGQSRNGRSAQYVQLATDVVTAPYFGGAGFSAGDQYLDAVANGRDGPGNPMTYVRAGVSRHLAVVLDRLATIGVP
jgi:hypothetical protein